MGSRWTYFHDYLGWKHPKFDNSIDGNDLVLQPPLFVSCRSLIHHCTELFRLQEWLTTLFFVAQVDEEYKYKGSDEPRHTIRLLKLGALEEVVELQAVHWLCLCSNGCNHRWCLGGWGPETTIGPPTSHRQTSARRLGLDTSVAAYHPVIVQMFGCWEAANISVEYGPQCSWGPAADRAASSAEWTLISKIWMLHHHGWRQKSRGQKEWRNSWQSRAVWDPS